MRDLPLPVDVKGASGWLCPLAALTSSPRRHWWACSALSQARNRTLVCLWMDNGLENGIVLPDAERSKKWHNRHQADSNSIVCLFHLYPFSVSVIPRLLAVFAIVLSRSHSGITAAIHAHDRKWEQIRMAFAIVLVHTLVCFCCCPGIGTRTPATSL